MYSTLLAKIPKGEYLDGLLYKLEKNTGSLTTKGIPFKYKNNDDTGGEVQHLTGFVRDKRIGMIYISSPIKVVSNDKVLLEGETKKRKITKWRYDSNKKTDLRLVGIKEKWLFVGKIVTLE